MTDAPQDAKTKLLQAALAHVPFDGWSDLTLREAAADSGLSMDQARANFLETTTDVQTASWGDWDNPEQPGVTGQVEWSESAQRGYMTFNGLAVNDVTAEQYQLWIFDRAQKDEHPVDGGVFDIPAGADEVIVPIDAKIDIQEAWQFAITVEKPGGVVVSERGRLPLLATTAS